MAAQWKEQLEGMIEHVHTIKVPECETHRYELRRTLLNSHYFSSPKNAFPLRPIVFVPIALGGLLAVSLFIGTKESTSQNQKLHATFFDDRPMIPVERSANMLSVSTVATALRVE